ncbi:MAG: SDR family oxidoreductase [Myxococcales bacterium]|nr:SDR family oxidoreductase [Myxococcales bacterium]
MGGDLTTTDRLRGHRALVVGGGSGIGLASARALVADGADVAIAGRTVAKLEAASEALRAIAARSGGSVRCTACDAMDAASVRDAVAFAAGDRGLDSALAVPGGGGYAPVLGYDVDRFLDDVALNLRPAFLVLKYAGLAMVRGGGGSIVLVSSTAAVMSTPFLAAYGAAKAAIDQLARVAADELGRFGVRVNAVRPGLTSTDATQGLVGAEAFLGRFLAQQPLARRGEADDQGQLVRFLAGPESGWVTGQCITVDGGHTLRRFPDMEDLARQVVGEGVFAAIERGEEPGEG